MTLNISIELGLGSKIGVNLKPLLSTKIFELENLKEKKLAVDANNILHQFFFLSEHQTVSLLEILLAM